MKLSITQTVNNMNLSSRTNGVFADLSEYSLHLTPQEYQLALKGESITHQTSSATISGTWIVKFKKNNKKQHRKALGLS